MFDWKRFVMLGYLLLTDDGEEYIRSGISRQYYGLFGVIRRYLINVNHKYYLESREGNVHHNVSAELRKSNNITQKEIYPIFNKLRVARNQADYDGDFDVSHFKKFLRDNEKDLKSAFDAIDFFKNHPNY